MHHRRTMLCARRPTLAHRKKHQPRLAGLLCGLALVVCGFAILIRHDAVQRAYSALSREAVTHDSVVPDAMEEVTNDTDTQLDWKYLTEQNEDVAAWIQVDGTSIDLPVLASHDSAPDFYLTHDLWGNPAFEGVPFLDHRCNANSVHRLVFGHHLNMGGQFSELQKAYEQDVLDGLGPCHWHTPKGGLSILMPLCSMQEDMWYAAIQRFSFEGTDSLRSWLKEIAQGADARSQHWEALAAESTSTVTLVTCSSDVSHQPWRTLVVFVEVSGSQSTG